MARHFLEVFGDAEYIVVPSGSCTAMIKHHYEDIFRRDEKMLAEVHRITRKRLGVFPVSSASGQCRRCGRAFRRRGHLSR